MMRLLMIFLLMLPLLANAEDFTDGNHLLSSCTSELRLIDDPTGKAGNAGFVEGYCLGIVSATLSTVYELNDDLSSKSKFCLPPDGITYNQGIRIVVKYLNDHPEKLHYRNIDLVLLSFRNAYPCGT